MNFNKKSEGLSANSLANIEALAAGEGAGGSHTLSCGPAGIKMCKATCGIHQVTVEAWGNGSLNTSDMDATDYMLTDMRFHRTVFYDLDGSFERLNPHLPANEQFHTFLLNEDNKTVLVGNPVHNEKLKNLYLAELDK
jgi:hypothetical protein